MRPARTRRPSLHAASRRSFAAWAATGRAVDGDWGKGSVRAAHRLLQEHQAEHIASTEPTVGLLGDLFLRSGRICKQPVIVKKKAQVGQGCVGRRIGRRPTAPAARKPASVGRHNPARSTSARHQRRHRHRRRVLAAGRPTAASVDRDRSFPQQEFSARRRLGRDVLVANGAWPAPDRRRWLSRRAIWRPRAGADPRPARALAVVAHLDRRLQAVLQYVLGEHPHRLGMQRLAPRGRHVDVIDGDLVDAQQGRYLLATRVPSAPLRRPRQPSALIGTRSSRAIVRRHGGLVEQLPPANQPSRCASGAAWRPGGAPPRPSRRSRLRCCSGPRRCGSRLLRPECRADARSPRRSCARPRRKCFRR